MVERADWDSDRELLAAGLTELALELAPKQADSLLALARLLHRWSRRTNLTGHRSLPAIVQRLILDAAALSTVLPRPSSLADLGWSSPASADTTSRRPPAASWGSATSTRSAGAPRSSTLSLMPSSSPRPWPGPLVRSNGCCAGHSPADCSSFPAPKRLPRCLRTRTWTPNRRDRTGFRAEGRCERCGWVASGLPAIARASAVVCSRPECSTWHDRGVDTFGGMC
jgi:hypothetical protein